MWTLVSYRYLVIYQLYWRSMPLVILVTVCILNGNSANRALVMHYKGNRVTFWEHFCQIFWDDIIHIQFNGVSLNQNLHQEILEMRHNNYHPLLWAQSIHLKLYKTTFSLSHWEGQIPTASHPLPSPAIVFYNHYYSIHCSVLYYIRFPGYWFHSEQHTCFNGSLGRPSVVPVDCVGMTLPKAAFEQMSEKPTWYSWNCIKCSKNAQRTLSEPS